MFVSGTVFGDVTISSSNYYDTIYFSDCGHGNGVLLSTVISYCVYYVKVM